MNQRRRQQSFQNLLDIKQICKEADIFFWIQNGLLLGLYRSGDCIEGDENDVDIGIDYKDMHRFVDVLPKFQELGFRTRVTKTPYKDVVTIALKINATKVHVHVNCKNEDMDITYQPMNKKGGVFVFTPEIYHMGFSEIEWQGERFNCPKNIEYYLVERYGDWKTPILKSDGWGMYDNKFYNPCYQDKL